MPCGIIKTMSLFGSDDDDSLLFGGGLEDIEEGDEFEEGMMGSDGGGGDDGDGDGDDGDESPTATDEGSGDNSGGGGGQGKASPELNSTTLNQKLYGILLNPNAEPSLHDGAPQQKAAAKKQQQQKGGKKKKSPHKKKTAAAADFDFDELMSMGGGDDGDSDDGSLMGSIMGGGGGGGLPSSFQQPSSAAAAAGRPSAPPVAFNPFYVSENMYPGELQSAMQERADLLNLYEMLRRRGLESKHDIESLGLEDLRFEVYRLQRLDDMGDAIDDYKTTMIMVMNIIEGCGPIIYEWTGFMINGISFRTHMAMERGDMNRAFQGIYHKRAKKGPVAPELALTWAIVKCFANVHNDNKRQLNQRNHYIHYQQPPAYYPPPPPQTYYPTEPLPQQQQQHYAPPPPQQQQHYAPPPQQQQHRQPPPETLDFYTETRQPELAKLEEQLKKPPGGGMVADMFSGLIGMFGGGGGGGAAPAPTPAAPPMSMAGPGLGPGSIPYQNQNPGQVPYTQTPQQPQYQATPSAPSNPLQLKDSLKKLQGAINNRG